eukprot:gene176-3566_t
MAINFAWFSIIFALVSGCIIFPPDEISQLGLHVNGLWRNYLGSEGLNFVDFHLRRSIATLVTHGLLLLTYGFGVWFIEPKTKPWKSQNSTRDYLLSVLSCLCLVTATVLFAFAMHWKRNKFCYHPTRRALQWHYSQDWERVKRAINAEFRHIDKVVVSSGFKNVIITSSWLLQTNIYTIDIALQSDADLSYQYAYTEHVIYISSLLCHGCGDETAPHSCWIHLPLSCDLMLIILEDILRLISAYDAPKLNSHEKRQLVRIRVTTVNPFIPTFDIIIDSENYKDISDKLETRIRNSRNIIIRQTLNEQFLHVLRNIVLENPFHYRGDMRMVDADSEECFGCSGSSPKVKIQIRSHAGTCFCRPMFCLDCLGKWFVSKQNERVPERWLQGSAECPTCRTPFTVQDISFVSSQSQS